MVAKLYSVLYKYKDLDGLQSALSSIHSVLGKFKDPVGINPTMIPYQQAENDPLAQHGYIGITFSSVIGPILPITVRAHDKESFDRTVHVQEE